MNQLIYLLQISSSLAGSITNTGRPVVVSKLLFDELSNPLLGETTLIWNTILGVVPLSVVDKAWEVLVLESWNLVLSTVHLGDDQVVQMSQLLSKLLVLWSKLETVNLTKKH